MTPLLRNAKKVLMNKQEASRAIRALEKQAAYPLSEGRRILKKKLHKLSDDQAKNLKAAISLLEKTLDGDDAEAVRSALNALDDLLHKELGKWYKSPARDWIESLAIALGVALFLRFFFIEAFKIPSGSMYPTLWVGDHIFVNKIKYGVEIPFINYRLATWSQPERGEVIVFRYPLNEKEDYIKRVIGLPGDHITVTGRQVLINGDTVACENEGDYEYPDTNRVTHHPTRYTCTLGDNEFEVLYEYTPAKGRFGKQEFDVPEGKYFCMGDNRDHSSDSRVWGYVPEKNIKGKALFIWLTWSDVHGLVPSRTAKAIH